MVLGGVSLDELFSPRGVAVVGASGAEKLSFPELVLHALKEAEFPAIYPVNPKYAEVLGLRCYPDLVSIPGAVDHVVVNIPAESALELLDQCAAKRIRSVHFFTAGFGESGFTGRERMERVRPRLLRWLNDRARFGYSEWLSTTYYGVDIRALVSLVDFAEDPEIRDRDGSARLRPRP